MDHGPAGARMDPARIVVLGGGFAGVSAAQELVRRLDATRSRKSGPGEPTGDGQPTGSRQPNASREPTGAGGTRPATRVTLLNRENYFIFQPLLTDIISGSIETTHVLVPLRRMFRGVAVEVGEIERLDTDRRVVTLRRPLSGERAEIGYDALIVALGSVTDFGSVPGMAEHAVGLRTLGDAFFLRNRALDLLEEARLEPDPDRQRELLTFVVVGGGSTGVEVAAEIHDLLELAKFADVDAEPTVILVHSGPYLLPSLGERLGRYATRKLEQVGVGLVLGRRLVSVEADGVRLDDGTRIGARTVVSTVGNAPNPVVRELPGPKDGRGWILPDPTFSVPGLDGVWALGDCASILDPESGRPMPATAQHAIREGPECARNVVAWLEGRPQRPFRYRQLGMLVSLGRRRGVGEVLGIKVSGFIAWLLWRGYYLLRLPSLERRFRVWLDWTIELFLPRDVVEIRVHRTRTRPGEAVGEARGEPVSAGMREDLDEELVI